MRMPTARWGTPPSTRLDTVLKGLLCAWHRCTPTQSGLPSQGCGSCLALRVTWWAHQGSETLNSTPHGRATRWQSWGESPGLCDSGPGSLLSVWAGARVERVRIGFCPGWVLPPEAAGSRQLCTWVWGGKRASAQHTLRGRKHGPAQPVPAAEWGARRCGEGA